jgi:hypothetical protein
MSQNEPEPNAKPPELPEWQRLIFCIIIPNAVVYIPTLKFLFSWTPRGDNYAGGIVDLVAVWGGFNAASPPLRDRHQSNKPSWHDATTATAGCLPQSLIPSKENSSSS